MLAKALSSAQFVLFYAAAVLWGWACAWFFGLPAWGWAFGLASGLVFLGLACTDMIRGRL